MDVGYTYSTGHGLRVSLYVPPGVTVPDTMRLAVNGVDTAFRRISDRDLECRPAPGVSGTCGNYECHRRALGECQCGRHETPVPFRPIGG